MPLDTYYSRVFLPISDVFQSWYVAPYGFDALFDQSYDLAISSGFNLIAEALTTPAYGEYCEDRSGRLIHLSDEPVLQGETPYGIESCQDPNDRFFIRPGDGRRPFSTFASQTGYYFFDKVLESGHYWTTLAALWGLLDPEAYVLGLMEMPAHMPFHFTIGIPMKSQSYSTACLSMTIQHLPREHTERLRAIRKTRSDSSTRV